MLWSAPERLQLATKYLDARVAFEKEAKKHREHMGVCPKQEHGLLTQLLESAYRSLEQARDELYQHSKDHHCA